MESYFELLHAMYQFPTRPPSQNQEEEMIQNLLNHVLGLATMVGLDVEETTTVEESSGEDGGRKKSVRKQEGDGGVLLRQQKRNRGAALLRKEEVGSMVVLLRNLVRKFGFVEPKEEVFGRYVDGSCGVMAWFPKYGCALVYRYVDFNTSLSVSLVILDGWQLKPANESGICSASAERFSTMEFRTIPVDLSQEFLKELHQVLKVSANEKGHQWTPAYVQACVESVLMEVLEEEVKERRKPMEPRGGTTDVGRHTASQPRCTSWPLIQAVMWEFCGERMAKRFLLQVQLADLRGLILFAKSVKDLLRSDFVMMMHVLQKAVDGLVYLATEFGFSVEGAERVISAHRASMDALLAAHRKRQRESSHIHLAPASLGDRLEPWTLRYVGGDGAEAQSSGGIIDNDAGEMERRAWKNMSGFDLPDADKWLRAEGNLPHLLSLGDLLKWLQSRALEAEWCTEDKRVFAFQLVSSYFCEIATNCGGLPMNAEDTLKLLRIVRNADDVKTILQVMKIYDKLSYKLLANLVAPESRGGRGTSVHMRYSRVRSMNFLVYWIATCLVHAFVCENVRMLKTFNLPISADHLSVLVVDDATAREALCAVFLYAKRFKNVEGKPIFNLNAPVYTMMFAREYARESAEMQEVWRREQEAARQREQKHWEQVEVVKKQLEQKRIERDACVNERNLYNAELAEVDAEMEASGLFEWMYLPRHIYIKRRDLKADIAAAKDQLRYLESSIARLKRNVPPVLVQPLPSEEDAALLIIYYVQQPTILGILEEMFYGAQEKICGCKIPAPKVLMHLVQERAKFVDVDPARMNIDRPWALARFKAASTHPVSGYRSGFGPCFTNFQQPENVKSVDSITRQNHEALCVSHADFTTSIMHESCHNPFQADMQSSKHFFSEQINPQVGHDLQWIVDYPMDEVEAAATEEDCGGEVRGNRILLEAVPPSFSKLTFLALGSIRSYPLQQFRKISVALREMQLDFNDRIVHLVIQQAFYQVGKLREPPPARAYASKNFPLISTCFEWMLDLYSHDLLKVLVFDLATKLYGLLGVKRKNFLAFYLMYEMAQFLEEMGEDRDEGNGAEESLDDRIVEDGQSYSVLFLCCKVAVEWAKEAREAVSKDPHSEEELLEEVLYSALAVLTKVRQPLEVDNAGELMSYFVRAQYALGQVQSAELKSHRYWNAVELLARARELLAVRMPTLSYLCASQKGKDEILTPAIRGVYADAPKSMSWRFWPSSPCFVSRVEKRQKPQNGSAAHGEDPSGKPAVEVHVYGINIMNGMVTLDGHPPMRLPPQVLQDELYKRTFEGVASLVVSSLKGGSILKTVAPLKGCYYEIHVSLSESEAPRIFEWSAESEVPEDDKLELVDLKNQSRWAGILPKRITSETSCWYGSSHNVLVVRPLKFSERDVLYLVDLQRPSRAYRAPRGLTVSTKGEIKQLVEMARSTWEGLYAVPTAISSVLSRFEAVPYMEIWARPCTEGEGKDDEKRPLVDGKRMEVRLELPRFRLYFQIRLSGGNGVDLVSLNYKGYVLSVVQTLETMPSFFRQYLVLEGMTTAGGQEEQQETRKKQCVLVPTLSGSFTIAFEDEVSKDGRCIGLELDGSCKASLNCHFYELHPRLGILKGRDFASRLMIAAVYAASSSALPEPGIGMTGAEMAISLVQQCFTNVVLDVRSARALKMLGFYAKEEPALALACDHLYRSANGASFLSEVEVYGKEASQKQKNKKSTGGGEELEKLRPCSMRTIADAMSRHELRLRSRSYHNFARHRTVAWEECGRRDGSRTESSIDLVLPSPTLQLPISVENNYKQLTKLLNAGSDPSELVEKKREKRDSSSDKNEACEAADRSDEALHPQNETEHVAAERGNDEGSMKSTDEDGRAKGSEGNEAGEADGSDKDSHRQKDAESSVETGNDAGAIRSSEEDGRAKGSEGNEAGETDGSDKDSHRQKDAESAVETGNDAGAIRSLEEDDRAKCSEGNEAGEAEGSDEALHPKNDADSSEASTKSKEEDGNSISDQSKETLNPKENTDNVETGNEERTIPDEEVDDRERASDGAEDGNSDRCHDGDLVPKDDEDTADVPNEGAVRSRNEEEGGERTSNGNEDRETDRNDDDSLHSKDDTANVGSTNEGAVAGSKEQEGGASEEKFPLPLPHGAKTLERDLNQELEKSWKSFRRSEKAAVQELDSDHRTETTEVNNVESLRLSKSRARAKLYRLTRESSEFLRLLLEVLNDTAERHSGLWRALRRANLAPMANAVDLLRIAVEEDNAPPSTIRAFNPFLLDEPCRKLRKYARMLMVLWVEEAKLQRLLAQATLDDFVEEVEVDRIWSVDSHPRWLAFEVEQQIKIRPVQYQVASHMLNHPGTICQLNMGMGKTRVILPMLILEWTRRTKHSECPRVHVMKNLLSDTLIYLQDVLSGSAIHPVPMFQQPFHRQVRMNGARYRSLLTTWKRMMQRGGYQVLAPEHGMSLSLTWHELRFRSPESSEVEALGCLLKKVEATSVNIFDESDELLSQRYQIVYATGTPAALDEISVRSSMLHAILRVFSRSRESHPRIEKLISDPNFAVRPVYVEMDGVPTGDISGSLLAPIELLPLDATAPSRKNPAQTTVANGASEAENVEDEGERKRQELRDAIFDALVDDSPKDLDWLRWTRERNPEMFGALKEMVLDVNKPVPETIDGLDWQKGYAQLLSLRGFLGGHILEMCMEKPYRVAYGLYPERSRLAVPFVAADVPSLRSDFNHPDVRLTLTSLSYLYEGLSKEQFVEALRKLLSLESSSRRWEYEQWVQPLRGKLYGMELLDSDDKLDVNDAMQLDVLFQIFRFSLEAVFFWLETQTFPTEMVQYPCQVKHSAWHLPLNRRAVGFSGTKDNAMLLPTCHGLQQRDLEVLGKTDGLMLFRMMMHATVRTLVDLQSGEEEAALEAEQPLWKQVVSTSLRMKMHAIIDAGSLLVGVRNADVARFLLDCREFDCERFRGVFYFEDGDERTGGHWAFLDAMTGLSEPRSIASAEDAEGFVIFDDARCRGSDFKLGRDACATLTLGKKLTKSKLMQSALRLRQLGRYQRIILLCPDHVERLIRRSSLDVGSSGSGGSMRMLTVADVLRWVMHNTVQEIEMGLLEWSVHGVFYNECREFPDKVQTTEEWSLKHCYGGRLADRKLTSLVSQIVERSCSSAGENSDADTKKRLGYHSSIVEKVSPYGDEIIVKSQITDNQAEREVLEERVAEREEHASEKLGDVLGESSWDYSAVLRCLSAVNLPQDVGVKRLFSLVKTFLAPKELQEIDWDLGRLYTTRRFYEVLSELILNKDMKLNRYLRPADALIFFPDESILMVSDKEAEGILKVIVAQKCSGFPVGIRLRNLAYLTPRLDQLGDEGAVTAMRQGLSSRLHEAVIVADFFNGQCNFASAGAAPSQKHEEVIRRMFRSKVGWKGISEHLTSRGTENTYENSHLYHEINRMAVEGILQRNPSEAQREEDDGASTQRVQDQNSVLLQLAEELAENLAQMSVK